MGGIVAHVVDHPDKAVIQHGMGGIKMRLHPLADRALRSGAVVARASSISAWASGLSGMGPLLSRSKWGASPISCITHTPNRKIKGGATARTYPQEIYTRGGCAARPGALDSASNHQAKEGDPMSIRYLHTMVRVKDLAASNGLLRASGLHETRRTEP